MKVLCFHNDTIHVIMTLAMSFWMSARSAELGGLKLEQSGSYDLINEWTKPTISDPCLSHPMQWTQGERILETPQETT